MANMAQILPIYIHNYSLSQYELHGFFDQNTNIFTPIGPQNFILIKTGQDSNIQQSFNSSQNSNNSVKYLENSTLQLDVEDGLKKIQMEYDLEVKKLMQHKGVEINLRKIQMDYEFAVKKIMQDQPLEDQLAINKIIHRCKNHQ
jgi:hypothetical protein